MVSEADVRRRREEINRLRRELDEQGQELDDQLRQLNHQQASRNPKLHHLHLGGIRLSAYLR